MKFCKNDVFDKKLNAFKDGEACAKTTMMTEKMTDYELRTKRESYKGFVNYETWWFWFNEFYNDDAHMKSVYDDWKETSDTALASYLRDRYEECFAMELEEKENSLLINMMARMSFRVIDWREIAGEMEEYIKDM